jgi:hypothetical protein
MKSPRTSLRKTTAMPATSATNAHQYMTLAEAPKEARSVE